MVKDSIRDYATAAFCLYAKNGRASYEQVREWVYKTALNDAWNQSPEKAVAHAEAEVTRHMPKLLDIMAVDKTIEIFKMGNETNIIKAIEAVYFTLPDKIGKSDIQNRVIRLSIELPASERSIYNWLKKARLLFASLRGLNINL